MSLQDVTRSSLCSGARNAERKVHTNFFLTNPLSESDDLQSWGCPKILLSFLMRFDGHLWGNQQQLQCLLQFESILDGHFARHVPAPFRLEIQKTTEIRLIGSEPHVHKTLAPIVTFLSPIDRLWNRILCNSLLVFAIENWLYKTSYNSYTVQDKQTKHSLVSGSCLIVLS